MRKHTHTQYTIMAVDKHFMPMGTRSRAKALHALMNSRTGAPRAFVLDLATYQRIPYKPGMDVKVIYFPHATAVSDARLGMGRGTSGILRRDGHVCQYEGCNKRANTVDHVIPKCQGGLNVWTNLVACCFECNQKKGPLTPAQAGMVLKKRPMSPQGILLNLFSEMAKTYNERCENLFADIQLPA